MLSWTVDSEGSVFADGVLLRHSDDWLDIAQTSLPTSTQLVAFELKTIPPSDIGLLASLDNTWSTGDPGMKCTNDTSVNETNAWKLYST